jgi:glycine/D-amino acid oxidase-like deaminating enzyme
MVNRRAFLKSGGIALGGLGLARCSARSAPSAPAHPPLTLAPVHASWDRVIRTTVGLRPFRPAGFVLRAEKLDRKLLVHNYGHGGSGMSLSWGTASMVAELALEHTERRAAVLGCGVVGLTSARELQRHGFDVTIYAATVPPDTTSNMSLAGFTPTSGLLDFRLRTPQWEEQFRTAVLRAYPRLQLLAGRRYGISWIHVYTPTDDPASASGSIAILPKEADPGQTLLPPGEHPFPTKYAVDRPMLRIEPSIYLDALVQDFHSFGGRIVIRKFEDPREVSWLSEPIVVNATGLGAKALFGDEELLPLKGQLTSLIPEAEVDYGTNGGLRSPVATPGIGIHMMPRSDGIVLGGTSERGVWTTEVNELERRRIVEGHIELFDAMRFGSASTHRPT